MEPIPIDPDELAKITADPSPLNPVPTTMYGEPAGPAGKYFDPFTQSAPLLERLGTALPMATIGFGAPTFLGRMGLNAAVGAGSDLLKGSSPEEAAKTGGLMAAIGGGAEGLGQAGRYLASAIPAKAFAAKSGQEVADWLAKNVPAWSEIQNAAGLPAKGIKALYEMAHGEGENLLSASYDKALNAAKDAIPEGTKVPFPEDMAKALKLQTEGGISPKIADLLRAAGKNVGDVVGQVDARSLLEKLPGTTGAVRQAIRDALGDFVPGQALREYKTGMGWLDFARRGNFLKNEQYDPVAANEALRKYGADELLSRGMQPVREMIRGPLADPITRQTPGSLPWYAGKLLAGTGAGLLGATHGNPIMGGAAGLAMTALPKPSFYRNVPPMYPQAGPLAAQGLRAVMPGFLGNMPASEQ